MERKSYLFFLMIVSHLYGFNKLNILFVVNQFPCISQRFIYEQIIEWIKLGHAISIHSFKNGDHIVIQSDSDEYCLDQRTTYGSILPYLQPFDIVAVQFGNSAQTVIHQAKKQDYSGKIVVSFRGYDISKFLQKNPGYYTDLFPDIDLCLPVCSFFKERLISLGCPPEKIFVHYSGVNLDSFPLKDSESRFKSVFNIITVARLVEKKGIEYGIRAVALLKKQFPNIQYFIIGDDNRSTGERKRLEKLAANLGLKNNVYFYGWKSHSTIIQYLGLMHLMILPSITSKDGDEEGIPNAIKEAMAVGLPVITTERVGSELVADGVSGFLVQEKNYKQLASKIAFFIQNPHQKEAFGRQGRLFIEKFFNIRETTKRLEKIFNDLLSRS